MGKGDGGDPRSGEKLTRQGVRDLGSDRRARKRWEMPPNPRRRLPRCSHPFTREREDGAEVCRYCGDVVDLDALPWYY